MPRMNGLDFFDKVMRLRPLPVIMISSLTDRGAAIDNRGDGNRRGGLRLRSRRSNGRILSTTSPTRSNPRRGRAGRRAHGGHRVDRAAEAESALCATNGRLVAIGASTGGVEALVAIVSRVPPWIVRPDRDHVASAGALHHDVRPAARPSQRAQGQPGRQTAAPILPGNVYVAPGSVTHLEIVAIGRRNFRVACFARVIWSVGHRPSVDASCFSPWRRSARRQVRRRDLDRHGGRRRQKGCWRNAQAREPTHSVKMKTSCVVYGMPKRRVLNCGAVEKQVPLDSKSPTEIAVAHLELPRKDSRSMTLANKLEVMVVGRYVGQAAC